MKYWKINNLSHQDIKIAIKSGQNISIGVILKEGEHCYAHPQLTRPLDAQLKRGYIAVESGVDMPENCVVGETYREEG